ncbi:MAG: EpsG family protein [Nostoc sp. NMS1]|uniref:EpsG family protein n=1 Tax=unclassified Nostoc TaxID=2593658 RepID=UPI0025FE4CBA|nr:MULTISPECIES: EpsG family protein [unclassified Nostoc]MBN3908049.1 EpsG family protein [Nostoc sp. NMS1]MBN3990568.1 EpsG family protein [Nostoc sp. NMS2]
MNFNLSSIQTNYQRYIFLFIGIIIWIQIPIIGVLPLLLFVFINSNSKFYSLDSLLNNSILLLVAVTVTLFCCLIDIQADTEQYLIAYRDCNGDNPIECFQSANFPFEPGFYFLASLLFIICNGSELGFLLSWSFIINFLTFFVICKGISKKYYALLILFVLLNPAFYLQAFLMRQFISSTFFLCALVSQKNKFTCVFFFFLSIVNHYSILLYLPIIIMQFVDVNSLLQHKLFNKFSVIMKYLSIILFVFAFIYSYSMNQATIASIIDTISSIHQLSFLAAKSAFFVKHQLASLGFLAHLILVAFVGYFYINLSRDNYIETNLNYRLTPEEKRLDISMLCLYVLQSILFLFTRNLDYLPLRLSLILLSFLGIFFYLPLERKSKLKPQIKFLSMVILTSLSVSYFFYFLQANSRANPTFNYLEGHIFTSSIIDYIELAISQW